MKNIKPSKLRKFIAFLFTPVFICLSIFKFIVVGLATTFTYTIYKATKIFYPSTWKRMYTRLCEGRNRNSEYYKASITDYAKINRDIIYATLCILSLWIVGESSDKMEEVFSDYKETYLKELNKDENIH